MLGINEDLHQISEVELFVIHKYTYKYLNNVNVKFSNIHLDNDELSPYTTVYHNDAISNLPIQVKNIHAKKSRNGSISSVIYINRSAIR